MPDHAVRAAVRTFILLCVCVGLWPRQALAHRDDYLDETLVYLTLEPHEHEVEYWFDHGTGSGPESDLIRHNTALEWGVTGHFMVDGRLTFASRGGNGTRFDSGRVESRYRFSDEGVRPVDVAASLEINTERESDGSTSTGVEPRLVLSKDVREALNFTLNLSEEIPLDSNERAFLASFGSRFNWTHLVRVGAEVHYDFDNHAGAAIPQVWFAFGHDITLKLGYSRGLDREPLDFVRGALEVEI